MLSRARIAALTCSFLFFISSLFHNRFRIHQRFKAAYKGDTTARLQGNEDQRLEDVESDLSPVASNACPNHLDWLRELESSPDVTFPLKYTRREIIVRPKPGVKRSSLTKRDEKLLPDFQTISTPNACEFTEEYCLPPIQLDVPERKPINAFNILFGAATTTDRLNASIPFFQRWLAHTGARLLIIVTGSKPDSPADTNVMASLQAEMRVLGMQVTLVQPPDKKDRHVERYYSLLKVLYRARDEGTKWFGFIDDDTFFTSTSALVSRLEDFDHQRRWYLGAVSEQWWTVVQYGWIAMGGGGIFLSLPMVETLVENYEDCKKSARTQFGDHRIAECINKTTDNRITQLDGLYQIDLHGDRSGVFESGRQIISQHHWKEGYWSEDGSGADAIRHQRWFPMDKMSYISEICGDTCFLQRFQFGPDTILTNGYSIAVYPKGLKGVPLFQMERTWAPAVPVEGSLNNGFDHYLGPLRPALELDKDKIHYRFMDAMMLEDGGVRQYFRHLGRDGELDSLVELRWTFENGSNRSTS